MIKRILVGTLALAFIGGATPVFANGNGNDGCHIPGMEDSHHNEQNGSNTHFVEMCEHEFDEYLHERNVPHERKNAKLFHLYENEGDKHQVETVHLRKCDHDYSTDTMPEDILIPEHPALPGGELPDIGVDFEDYPVLEGEDNIQINPNEEFPPAVGEGEDDMMVDTPATEGGDLPDIGVDFEDYPVLEGEDDMGVDFEDYPVLEGEDNNGVDFEDFPVLEGEDEMGVDQELPTVGDGTGEDKIEVEQEPIAKEEEEEKLETLPQTGEPSTMLFYGLGAMLSGAGLILNRKK